MEMHVTREQGLQRGSKRSPVDTMNSKPLPGTFREKELMHHLNGRLAAFIEKVRHLEHHNQLLEREIGGLRGTARPASRLEEERGPELRRLRQLVQDITHQKRQIEIEHRRLEEELSDLKRRRERESRGRSDAGSHIAVLKRDISDAYESKLQLDKKAQGLVDEIRSLKGNREAVVSQLLDQIQDAQVTVEARGFGDPGLTAALGDIRAQLEGHIASDTPQVGDTFRSQLARLTGEAESKREALKTAQLELQEHRRSLQARSTELECAQGTREALEKQLHEVEDRHTGDIIQYQNTIKELENELMNCKFDMSGYLREYQDLLNVKMALDVEIMSYRKLLCGEEARLSTMSDAHVSLPYIYHQSPVYTLPCLGRRGGPHRRAEPKYKFVEEIITETTREIEMSEFEETGSEETDEQEWTKRARGCCEEEEDNDEDCREEEGQQVSDGEQNRSGGHLMNGSDNGTPGETDDGEKVQRSEKESEAVDDEGESGMDENREEGNEQYKNVTETTEEKEAAVPITDDKYLTSNTDDLRPEVAVKDELLEEADADEDGFTSAQLKKPVDEAPAQVFMESHTTQEPSGVQVQDKIPTSETAEKAADVTAETKITLTAETGEISGKPQASSSSTSKSDVKETGHTVAKETNKSEAAKGEDKVAKGNQDARNGSNKGQDKEWALKLDVKSLPEVEDKTQMFQTDLSREKTSVSAEIKELHQGASEGSQVQKSKPSELSENN